MVGFGVVGYVFKKIGGEPLAPLTPSLVLAGSRAEDAFRLFDDRLQWGYARSSGPTAWWGRSRRWRWSCCCRAPRRACLGFSASRKPLAGRFSAGPKALSIHLSAFGLTPKSADASQAQGTVVLTEIRRFAGHARSAMPWRRASRRSWTSSSSNSPSDRRPRPGGSPSRAPSTSLQALRPTLAKRIAK